MIFFNIKITTYWIDSGQLKLTCQFDDLDYEIMITIQKKIKTNYEA